jgi:hypothetical protein
VLGTVATALPLVAPAARDRVLGAYDRRLRSLLGPVERALWSRGLIA